MRSTKLNTTIIGICCLIFVLFGSALMAQSNETILTIALPEWVANNIKPDAFSAFEAQNPGVKVVVVNLKNAFYFSGPDYDVEEYLDNVENVVNLADVIYPGMNNEIITPYATRAGYFLDLSPIVNSDMTLNQEDFYPVAWEAYQWDRGIWGLPMAVSPSFLIYSQTKFDNLGIPYPNEAWTIEDFVHAQRLLREEDASGNVIDPGFLSFGDEIMRLLRGFLGRDFVAPGTDNLQPDFTSPDLENLLTTWLEYRQEGLLGNWRPPEGNFTFDMANQPLSINQSYMLTLRNSENVLQGSLLPGGIAPVMVAPIAVSAGTQYPELAYELAKFMASDITAFDIIRDGSPARRSLAGQEETASMVTFSAETEALIEQALENGVSTSQMLFSNYISRIISQSEQDDFPGLSIALQEAEQKVLEDLQAAEARRNQTILAVATPVPTPSLSDGQIAIDFGVNNMASDLVNEELWNRLVDEFIASNPQVGRVTVKADFLYSAEQMAERYDCFYLPFNATTANTSSILSLDPFFDTDMNFDRNGFLGTVLQQVQHDNRTWAYPIDLKPEFMWYHRELFSQASIPSPENGWTVSEFVDALTALKLADSESKPFTPRSYGSNTYLLMLMAAYGGVPFDYRTTPATVNLTAPETVDAIRQVLDLAKNGYIEYETLSYLRQSGGGGVMMGMSSGGDQTAIYNEMISPYTFQLFGIPEYENPYRMTSYPTGTQYTPVTYDIGTAYISATNENPEACYKWISTIAQNPALFNSVPAQRSNMDNAALLASTGSSMGDYIQQLDMLLSSPTTIEFPSGQSSATASVENMLRDSSSQIWFNDALDAYVLEENVDLEQELAKAEQYINEYMACQANIPAVDQNLNIYDENPETIEKIEQVYKDYIRCVVQVDDTLYSALSYLLDN